MLDTHELTAEAATTFDRKLVRRALATDPLVCYLDDARPIREERFAREQGGLHPRCYV